MNTQIIFCVLCVLLRLNQLAQSAAVLVLVYCLLSVSRSKIPFGKVSLQA
jgi:hypothetical protein